MLEVSIMVIDSTTQEHLTGTSTMIYTLIHQNMTHLGGGAYKVMPHVATAHNYHEKLVDFLTINASLGHLPNSNQPATSIFFQS